MLITLERFGAIAEQGEQVSKALHNPSSLSRNNPSSLALAVVSLLKITLVQHFEGAAIVRHGFFGRVHRVGGIVHERPMKARQVLGIVQRHRLQFSVHVIHDHLRHIPLGTGLCYAGIKGLF